MRITQTSDVYDTQQHDSNATTKNNKMHALQAAARTKTLCAAPASNCVPSGLNAMQYTLWMHHERSGGGQR
jgi:hypothetical protein